MNLDDAPARVKIQCRCGATSAVIRATDDFGPVLVSHLPETKAELAAVNDVAEAAGLPRARPARATAIHFLEEPYRQQNPGPPEIACAGSGGRDRGHGPLDFDEADLLEHYRLAGIRRALPVKLDPVGYDGP